MLHGVMHPGASTLVFLEKSLTLAIQSRREKLNPEAEGYQATINAQDTLVST